MFVQTFFCFPVKYCFKPTHSYHENENELEHHHHHHHCRGRVLSHHQISSFPAIIIVFGLPAWLASVADISVFCKESVSQVGVERRAIRRNLFLNANQDCFVVVSFVISLL